MMRQKSPLTRPTVRRIDQWEQTSESVTQIQPVSAEPNAMYRFMRGGGGTRECGVKDVEQNADRWIRTIELQKTVVTWQKTMVTC